MVSRIAIKGRVASGRGEGRFFLSLKGYQESLGRLLGFAAFPGTLNIEIGPEDVGTVQALKERSALATEKFKEGEKTYYPVKMVRARCLGEEGALIFPLIGHHPSTIVEFICPVGLRAKHGLKDGDEITLEMRG